MASQGEDVKRVIVHANCKTNPLSESEDCFDGGGDIEKSKQTLDQGTTQEKTTKKGDASDT